MTTKHSLLFSAAVAAALCAAACAAEAPAASAAQDAAPDAVAPAAAPDHDVHAASDAPWPYPQDIPVLAPIQPGLAGAGAPDIARFLKVRTVSGAQLSADGETLAFRTNTTGEPQLWTVDAQGGWPRQLTFGGAVSTHRWTPNGDQILYGADREGDERLGLTLISADGSRETTAYPYSDAFISIGDLSPDGDRLLYSTTARNGVDFDIHLRDLTTGADRLVAQGVFGYDVLAWRPRIGAGGTRRASDEAVVSVTRGEDANDIYLLNIETGARELLFAPEVASAYEDVTFEPGGAGFYLVTDHEREHRALAYYDLASKELSILDAPEGVDVDQLALADDGRALVWTINEGGYSVLRARDVEDVNDLEPPANLPRGVYSLHGAANAPLIAITVRGPQTPGDVYVWNAAQGGPAVHAAKSEAAGINLAAMVTPESLFFDARDGVQLNGLLYRPTGLEGPAPLLVTVHGGPTAQARPDWDAVTQYLVAQGIAVFDLNFRGSTGFGKTFARLDNQTLRRNAVNDVVDAVAFLQAGAGVDAGRAAVMGGSYGGYLTNAVLGEHPDVFRAGVSFVGVSDWVRALETASPGLKASDQIEYGDITDPDVRAFHAALSPMNTVDAITADVMVLHGANDPRDPVAESDHFVEALRANGAEVTYLRFPDEGHGIRKTANRITAYRQVVGFLKDALEVAPAAGETGAEAPEE